MEAVGLDVNIRKTSLQNHQCCQHSLQAAVSGSGRFPRIHLCVLAPHISSRARGGAGLDGRRRPRWIFFCLFGFVSDRLHFSLSVSNSGLFVF